MQKSAKISSVYNVEHQIMHVVDRHGSLEKTTNVFTAHKMRWKLIGTS